MNSLSRVDGEQAGFGVHSKHVVQVDKRNCSMSEMPQTDAALVELVKQGNARAFELLVVKYQSRIQSIVYKVIRDFDESLDVTQEVFVRAYKAIGSFRGDSQFYTWLYRIAINTSKNLLQNKSRKVVHDQVDSEVIDFFESPLTHSRDNERPEDHYSANELKKLITLAIDQLPVDFKTALTLREIEGLSYDEIADVTSAFNAFNLLGRLMVTNATTVPSSHASTGIVSMVNTSCCGGVMNLPCNGSSRVHRCIS